MTCNVKDSIGGAPAARQLQPGLVYRIAHAGAGAQCRAALTGDLLRASPTYAAR
ncbi:hypothetical protein [Kribbella sp. HUAS MG21]|uniref:Uncharacterized protein n=1 Tax=Kribbella sp. HUAS MG21 TaxID=3160966 RepID=A0AAU7THN9_9ACTN